MDFGDDPDGSDGQRKKKRHHRHTPRQIQQLEGIFKECPHPDEKQRMQLSRDLGLESRQIKFWFQNRRTQMKAQHERADNCFLRAENDKIRCENIAMREALKNVICPTCGGPSLSDDSYFDEQKLRMDNARLKEELDRVSSLTSKYLGRPITHLPPVQPLSIPLSDLSIGGIGAPAIGGPSLDLDLLIGSSSVPLPFPMAVPEFEKPIMADMAAGAMDEVIRMVRTDEPLWLKPVGGDCPDVLDLETYYNIFAKPGSSLRAPGVRVEASRDSQLVCLNAIQLVDVFMDSSKCLDFFPTIISKVQTLEILAHGMAGRNGSLVLMYQELHVLSPVIPTREFYFLRYCRQIEHGLWAIADVSVDSSRADQLVPPSRPRRLPSGCLIQDMANGYCKVSWVEHVEIEDKAPIHLLYRDVVISGSAFGAHRWLGTLQRTSERFACLMAAGSSPGEIGGSGSPDGKRGMMKLSQRMVASFCASLSAGHVQQWTTPPGMNDVGIRVTVHRSSDPGHPNGIVLSAATSLWLPVSCKSVFAFVRDENTRSQWDALSIGNLGEVARITNESNPGNCISLLRGLNSSQNSMLILQESCTDASGSLVVYAPVNVSDINAVMRGEDPSCVVLLPSGFAILPDGRSSGGGGEASTSSNPLMGSSAGSLVTVVLQILVSSLPTARLDAESVATINNVISTTVQNIKAALNCPGGG